MALLCYIININRYYSQYLRPFNVFYINCITVWHSKCIIYRYVEWKGITDTGWLSN